MFKPESLKHKPAVMPLANVVDLTRDEEGDGFNPAHAANASDRIPGRSWRTPLDLDNTQSEDEAMEDVIEDTDPDVEIIGHSNLAVTASHIINELLPSAEGPPEEVDESHRQLPGDHFRTHSRFPPSDCNGPLHGEQPAQPLRQWDTVELRSGDFLRIFDIIEEPSKSGTTSSQFYIRGLYIQGASKTTGILPQACEGETETETFIELDHDDDDQRRPFQQGQRSVRIEQVLRKRRLIITNTPPENATIGNDTPAGVLVCRWVRVNHFATSYDRLRYRDRHSKAKQPTEMEIRLVRETEADPEHTIDGRRRRNTFLGYVPRDKKFYTGADVCCCGGGASSAMATAGVRLDWALDKDGKALVTYRLNFPNVEVIEMGIEDAIPRMKDKTFFKVEILHISWSCKPFSHANTTPNEELDALNTALIFATSPLIQAVKPRVVFLENTSGLAWIVKHKPMFHALLAQLTETGYSVRWKVSHFDAYGVPQKRRRLLIFAACPGGTLPPFPEATHGPMGPYEGRPYTTIEEALAPLVAAPPGTYSHHHPEEVEAKNRTNQHKHYPYPSNRPLRNCITTGGSIDWHPNGRRPFTAREYSLLQGFPINYKFPPYVSSTKVTEQIGNACPPSGCVKFYTSAIEALAHEDAETNGRERKLAEQQLRHDTESRS